MNTRPTFLSHTLSSGNEDGFRPQLTSLIDVMTILLIFLIKSFSVEGSLVTPSKDLELPLSSAKETPEAVMAIEITKSSIVIDGAVIAQIEHFAGNDTMVIPALKEWMDGRAGNVTSNGPREVMIQSDRNVEFNVVKRVLYTCSQAGYENFSILVQEQG